MNRLRSAILFAVLAFTISAASFSASVLLDEGLAKNSMTYLDEARAIRGDFPLNRRATPSFHPLYSVLTAAAWVPGRSWEMTGRLVSVLCAALIVAVPATWVRSIAGTPAGWATAIFAITNVMVFGYAGSVTAESLGLLLSAAGIALVWSAGLRASWKLAALAGLAAGLFALARTEGVGFMGYILPPLAVLTWRTSHRLRPVIVNVAACIAVSLACLVPYIVHLREFNDRISIYPDVKYFAAASALRRLPDRLWGEIDALPAGTPTTSEYVGIRKIEGIGSKTTYVVREYAEFLHLIDRRLLSSMLGVLPIMLVALCLLPPGSSEGPRSSGLVTYLIYLCFFTLVFGGLVVAAFDLEKDARRLLYLLPPALMLAGIGAARASEVLAEHARTWPARVPKPSAGTFLALILAAHVLIATPALYWHFRALGEENATWAVLRRTGAFIRQQAGDRPPVVASDDLNIAWVADGWYVPIASAGADQAVAVARRYGAEYFAVQGTGVVSRRPGMEALLTRHDVPDGLAFLREFGDSTGFHVVVYRVLPEPPAAASAAGHAAVP